MKGQYETELQEQVKTGIHQAEEDEGQLKCRDKLPTEGICNMQ